MGRWAKGASIIVVLIIVGGMLSRSVAEGPYKLTLPLGLQKEAATSLRIIHSQRRRSNSDDNCSLTVDSLRMEPYPAQPATRRTKGFRTDGRPLWGLRGK